MATFFLIRHASCDGLGQRLNSRTPGVHLNEKGRREAAQLAERLAEVRITAIFSSPLERAHETAVTIANGLNVSWQTDEILNEIDYGEWTGKNFQDLRDLPEWQQFNACRCSTQIPGGENMRQVRLRARTAIDRFRKFPADGTIALVSHADWIRAAVSEYTRVSLDLLKGFQVDPASVSVMRVEDWGASILHWNDTGPLKNIL